TGVAAERGITLDVAPDSRLGPVGELADDLVTALGNLIENAFDAIEGWPTRVVRVEIGDDGLQIRARVRNSGPGVHRTTCRGSLNRDSPPNRTASTGVAWA